MALVPARRVRQDNQVALGRPGIDSSVSDALTTASGLAGDIGTGAAKVYGKYKDQEDRREANLQALRFQDNVKTELMRVQDRVKNLTDDDLNGKTVDQVTEEIYGDFKNRMESEFLPSVTNQRAKDTVDAFRAGNEGQWREATSLAVKQRNEISISTQTTATFNKTIEEADSIENARAVGDDLEFIAETAYGDQVVGWRNQDQVVANVTAAKRDAYTRGLRAEIQKNPELALRKLSNPEVRAEFEQVMGADNVESLHQAAVSGQVRRVQATFQRELGVIKGSAKLDTAGRIVPGMAYGELTSVRDGIIAARQRAEASLRMAGLSPAESDMVTLGRTQLDDRLVNELSSVFNEVRHREYVFKVLNTDGMKADPSNPVAVEAADAAFTADIIPQFESAYIQELQDARDEGRSPDIESQADVIAQHVEKFGFSPPTLNAYVAKLASSDDTGQVQLSLRVMERMRAIHPPSFAALPEETRSQLTAYSVLTDAGFSEQEAADQARQLSTGNYRTERGQALQQEWATFAEDERITTGLADTMKSELSPWYAFGVPDSFPPEAQRHFKMLVQRNYVLMQEQGDKFFDPEARMKLAIKKAGQDFQGVYNVTKIGASKVWMRGAPEAEFAIAGREDQSKWMGSHLKQALSTDATERVLLDNVELFQYPDSPDGKPVYAVFQRTDVGVKPVMKKPNQDGTGGGLFIWRPSWDEAPENIATRMTAAFIRSGNPQELEAAVRAKVQADDTSAGTARTEILQAQADYRNGNVAEKVLQWAGSALKADGKDLTPEQQAEREQMRIDAERRAQETINANLGQ